MTALSVHLWKEWRDHRVGVIAFVAAIVAFAFLFAFVLRDTCFEGSVFDNNLVLGSLLGAVVLFAPDAIRSDSQRGTLGFLMRQPRGPHLAFWGKAGFLVAVVVGTAVVAHTTAVLVRLALAPNAPFLIPDGMVEATVHAVVLACACSMWIFAVACCMPRAVMSIPAAALMLAVLSVPAAWLLNGKWVLVEHLQLRWISLAHPAAATFVAWVSFAYGRRLGRGPGGAAWRGAIAALVVFLPVWSWVYAWTVEWSTPRTEAMLIDTAYLGTDGKRAFLNTRRGSGWPRLGVIVDLESGRWQAHGEPSMEFMKRGFGRRPFDDGATFARRDIVLFGDAVSPRRIERLEGSTAKSLGFGSASTPYRDLIDRGRAAVKRESALRLPDGRRAWLFRDRLELERADGGFEELAWDDRDEVNAIRGFGLEIRHRRGFVIYDLTRARRFDDRVFRWHRCFVLSERWLVGDPRLDRNWRLLDPDSGDEVPAPGMQARDEVIGVLEGDRVMVRSRSTSIGMVIWIVDPRTGDRDLLRFTTGRHVLGWTTRDAPVRTDDGRWVLTMTHGSVGTAVTSLLPGTATLTPLVPAARLVAPLDPSRIVTIGPDHDTLEEVDLDTGERRVLFPSSEPTGR